MPPSRAPRPSGSCATCARCLDRFSVPFGLTDAKRAQAARIINDAMAQGLIKQVNPDTSPRHMCYEPFWA